MTKAMLAFIILIVAGAPLTGDLSQNLLARYLFSSNAMDSSGNGNH